MKKERMSKDMYYLKLAEASLGRSTCILRNYGALIVNHDEVVCTGYNGSARDEDNCIETGICERERLGVPKGERYELCVAVTAQQNCIISASRKEMMGGTMYIVGKESSTGKYTNPAPSMTDRRLIKNAGIIRLVGLIDGKAVDIDLGIKKKIGITAEA